MVAITPPWVSRRVRPRPGSSDTTISNRWDGPAMWERIAEYVALLCLLFLWAKYYHNYPAKK